MGLILDTGLLIQAERLGLTMPEAVASWKTSFRSEGIGVAVVSLTELGHGIARAKSERGRISRTNFVSALGIALPVYSLSEEIALQAGILDGELAQRGISIGLADVLIATTALKRGDGVATLNSKHFRSVPGLRVLEM